MQGLVIYANSSCGTPHIILPACISLLEQTATWQEDLLKVFNTQQHARRRIRRTKRQVREKLSRSPVLSGTKLTVEILMFAVVITACLSSWCIPETFHSKSFWDELWLFHLWWNIPRFDVEIHLYWLVVLFRIGFLLDLKHSLHPQN